MMSIDRVVRGFRAWASLKETGPSFVSGSNGIFPTYLGMRILERRRGMLLVIALTHHHSP
jgi:hypothetical protein